MFFFENYPENEAGRLVAELFLFFKYAEYEVKASGLQLSFNIFCWSSTQDSIKTNFLKLYILLIQR